MDKRSIPRVSRFNLTLEEKECLREKNDSELKKRLSIMQDNGIISEQDLANQLIVDLYYRIGMEDFWIYRDVNEHFDITAKESKYIMGDVVQHLIDRSEYSARLQVLLEDMVSKGLDIVTPLDPKVGKTYIASEELKIYHGTAESLNTKDIGKPDKNGVYAIRDGISYWTPNKSVAERYTRPNREHKARGIVKGETHEKTIYPGDMCCTIADTHGGAFAMWQDEILELCKSGVKYLFSAKPQRDDVFDIENFADFVQKRDECVYSALEKYNLRLPVENESLAQYITQLPTRLEILSQQKAELEASLRERQKELEAKQADISPSRRRESYEKSE